MAESPVRTGGILKRKVAGVPVIYLALGFVLILAVVAWQMKPSADLAQDDADAEADAATPTGSDEVLPPMPSGTVVVQPRETEPEAAPYEDNSTWRRKAVTYLIGKGVSVGEAELAMQAYLAGNTLSFRQGELRDMAVKGVGLPPDDFQVGNVQPKPTVPPIRVPGPVPKPPTVSRPTPPYTPKPKPAPKPVPKPAPPAKRTHIVRPGENLTSIGRKYGRTWQQIYNANRNVIKDPNKIYPGQRLVIP